MGSWTLNYDALNRLTMATGSQVVDGNSSYAWTYDSFGNRQTQTGNGNMGTVTTQADSSNASPHNQIISTNARGVPWTPGYDAAGNMQDDGANRYLYDADGRVCATAPIGSSTGTQYLYDASGKRVAKGTITSWSCDTTSNGFTLTTQYIIGPNGEQMTEIAYNGSSPTWSHTNVPLPGAMATYLNDGQEPHFRLTDWLGTTRAQTSSVGTAELTCQSLPFGDPTSFPCTSTPATEQFFTGYERDSETGNDYAQARHYANSMGRFLSPDPSGLKYADQMNPQSFNLYSYVRNNPLINTDPTGLECVWDDGSYDSNDDPSTGDGAVDQSGNHTGCSGQGGTWIDHSYFSDNNMADWSSQANQTLADMTTPTITVTAPDNPALMQSASFMMSQVQSWGNNITGLSNIMSYTALDAFKWAFDGKHTPNGCASGLAGCVYFYGNWCGKGGSGAPVDAVDAACMVHDFLYEKFGFTLPSNYQGGNEALQVINQGLCNTTVDLQPGVPAAEINLYFGPIVSAGNIGKGGSPACK
jgi:RHS repeat-associated protein